MSDTYVIGGLHAAPAMSQRRWRLCRARTAQALRQFQFRVGASNFCVVHVSLVPVLGAVGEQKTKPTQHSVAVLRSLGLNPTLLVCRSSDPLQQSVREKLVPPFLPII